MIKIKKSAAYWTLGIGAFLLLALMLCPPHIWTKVESLGHSGYVTASNKVDSWVSRRPSGNVIMVADASMGRPQQQQRQKVFHTKPRCLRWHRVKRGQTQWFLAQAYNNRKNKQEWLRGMRWLSGKRTNDDTLKVGESVCVHWARRV